MHTIYNGDEPLPENASQNHAIVPKSLYCIYRTTLQCFSFCSCTITVLHSTYVHLPEISYHFNTIIREVPRRNLQHVSCTYQEQSTPSMFWSHSRLEMPYIHALYPARYPAHGGTFLTNIHQCMDRNSCHPQLHPAFKEMSNKYHR